MVISIKSERITFTVICKYIILLLLIFNVRYPVVWTFLPITVTRIIQILGLLFFIKHLAKRNFLLEKRISYSLLLFCFLILFSFCPSILSGSEDTAFFKFSSNTVWYFFSSFFIIKVFSSLKLSITNILELIVFTGVFQACISLFMFVNPTLYNMIMSMITLTGGALTDSILVEYRLMGIGNSFWTAGVNYGMDLLFLTVLAYLGDSYIYKKKILYWCCIIIVIVAGILSARTFFISLLPIGLFILITNKKILSFFISSFKTIVIIVLLLLLSIKLLSNFIDIDRFEKIFSWALEIFINFFAGDGMQSSSTDTMFSMYVFPDNIKTWLIGDGFYEMSDGSYYKGTDIGFLRQIYYYGIIGLVFYWVVLGRFYKCTASYYKNKPIVNLIKVMFLFSIVLSFKGIIDLSSYITLICVYGYMNTIKLMKNDGTKRIGVSDCAML